jgi:hypothetical protein
MLSHILLIRTRHKIALTHIDLLSNRLVLLFYTRADDISREKEIFRHKKIAF